MLLVKSNYPGFVNFQGLGRAGELSRVAPGYARNFLFPRKMAGYAPRESMKTFKKELSAGASRTTIAAPVLGEAEQAREYVSCWSNIASDCQRFKANVEDRSARLTRLEMFLRDHFRGSEELGTHGPSTPILISCSYTWKSTRLEFCWIAQSPSLEITTSPWLLATPKQH
jgi:hypothetical protein